MGEYRIISKCSRFFDSHSKSEFQIYKILSSSGTLSVKLDTIKSDS